MPKPPRKARTPKVSPEAVKAAAARAAARSAGEEIAEPKAPITPPIITAEEIKAQKARSADAVKRKRRRHKYSAPLGKAICKMLAAGMTLNQVCKRHLMPPESTVRGWAIDPQHPFSANYVRAREIGYARMADQIIDIADHSVNDYITRLMKDGGTETVVNRECLERTRLRIDTRKWLLSKALPKMFGDKVAHEVTGKDGGPIETREDRPQPTGSDHLAEITGRYAARAPQATVPAKPAGKGPGLH